jgi:hypothetical protein
MQRILPCFLVGLAMILAGCGDGGPTLIPVKGKVSYDGKPLETGLVRFEPLDGKSASGKGGVIANGEYTALVPAGELLVKISSDKIVGKRKRYDMPDSPMDDVTEQVVPKKYNIDSKLKVNVQAKKDDLDFELKK